MAKEKKNTAPEEEPQTAETAEPQPEVVETPEVSELDAVQAELAKEHDQFLRLAAEYDNFRKRNAKEREALYTDIKAETAAKFLPVFDNLERALSQPTTDEAYKKGVEMTMTQLREVMTKLGITEFGAAGDSFDPNRHNAVMHVEDETLGENVIAEVFQKGFAIGEKIVRHAMVKVAN